MPRAQGLSASHRVPATAAAMSEFLVTTSRAVGGSDARMLRSCATVNPWHQMPASSWHPSSSRRSASWRTSSAAPRIDGASDAAELRTDVIGGGGKGSAWDASVRARVISLASHDERWVAGFLSTVMMG